MSEGIRFGIAFPPGERPDILSELEAMKSEARNALGMGPMEILTSENLVHYLLLKVAHLSCHAGATKRANEKFYEHVGTTLDQHDGKLTELYETIHGPVHEANQP